jgi:hypothetical protein
MFSDFLNLYLSLEIFINSLYLSLIAVRGVEA